MTDVIELTKRVMNDVEWQLVPEDMTIDDMVPFVIDAIEYFYVMIGQALSYSDDLVIYGTDGSIMFDYNFALDERMFIIVTAEINFYRKVQSDVNELESYTTDAMSVANADKPFANLKSMIDDLKDKQIEIWHKMPRYNML